MIVQLSEIRRGDLVRMSDRSVLSVERVSTIRGRVVAGGRNRFGQSGRVSGLCGHPVEVVGRVAC